MSTALPREASTTAGKTQTVFIHKLYDMLSDPDLAHLIWWAPSSESFYLLPTEEFSKVLALYFKHTNIASFIRQLNMYGFHKVNDAFQNEDDGHQSSHQNSNEQRWEFKHSAGHFRRGDVSSLRLIKRRSLRNANAAKEVVNFKTIPTSNPTAHTVQPALAATPVAGAPPGPASSMAPALPVMAGVPAPANMPAGAASGMPPGLVSSPALVLTPLGRLLSPAHREDDPQLPSNGLTKDAFKSQNHPTHPPHPGQAHPNQPSRPSSSYQAPLAQPQPNLATANMVVELNNNLNSLRSDCFALAARLDAVVNESRESHLEMLQVVELLQRLVGENEPPQPPQPPQHQTSQPNQPPIQQNQDTPKAQVRPQLAVQTSNSQPAAQSGTAGPPNNAVTAAALSDLRARIQSRLQQPLMQPLAPAPQSRASSNPNIVPQQYPLNPYYSIFSQDRVFRFASADQPHERNMSFMDPLQRPNELDPRLRVDLKNNSPLSASGTQPITLPSSVRMAQNIAHHKQQLFYLSPQPLQGVSSGRNSLLDKHERPHSISPAQVPKNHHPNHPNQPSGHMNGQQFPFPNMMPTPSNLPPRRTSSMPTIEPSTPDHTGYLPRRSWTDVMSGSEGPPRSLPAIASDLPVTPSDPQQPPNHPKPNLLPSVSELDKSLKPGSQLIMDLLSPSNKRRVDDMHDVKRLRP